VKRELGFEGIKGGKKEKEGAFLVFAEIEIAILRKGD
jgi:hypothetical protein